MTDRAPAGEIRLALGGDRPRLGALAAVVLLGPGNALAVWAVVTFSFDDAAWWQKVGAVVALACALAYAGASFRVSFRAPRTYGAVVVEEDTLRIVQPFLFPQPLVLSRDVIEKVVVDGNGISGRIRPPPPRPRSFGAIARNVGLTREAAPGLTNGGFNGVIVLEDKVEPPSQTLWARLSVPLDRFSALYFRAADPSAASEVLRREGLLGQLSPADQEALRPDTLAKRRVMIRAGLATIAFLASWLALVLVIGEALRA